mgnify:CR=1 FL=1
MTNDAELVLAAGDELGEGPVWHSEEQALYWVDIDGRRYHRLEPSTERHDIFNVGEMIGALALYRHGSVVLATERGFSFYDPSQNTLTPIGDPEADKPESRFNDGAVDRAGRFWAGTLGDGNNNSLYRLDPSGVIQRINLLDPNWPLHGPFDAIFCRNVMIYFDKPTQYKVLARFKPLLHRDGLIFAGHSESFTHATDLFRSIGRTVYERADAAR